MGKATSTSTTASAPLVCVRPPKGMTGLREVQEHLDAGRVELAIFYLCRVIENVESALAARIAEAAIA